MLDDIYNRRVEILVQAARQSAGCDRHPTESLIFNKLIYNRWSEGQYIVMDDKAKIIVYASTCYGLFHLTFCFYLMRLSWPSPFSSILFSLQYSSTFFLFLSLPPPPPMLVTTKTDTKSRTPKAHRIKY